MKGILADLLIKLGLDSKGLNDGIDKAKKKTDAFGEGIKKLGAMIGVAFSVGVIIAFGKELINLSGKVTGVANAFKKIDNSQSILSDLRDATRNTVDDLKLMQLAIQAKNFKIPLEQLSTLLKFASDRAIETGQSVDYLTESIILGIARKSIPIMDNLGISSVELQSEFAKTGDFAKAAANIIEREMYNAGEVLDTMGTKVQQISTKWENWKQKIATTPKFIEIVSGNIDELDDNITVMLSDISGWKKFWAFIDLTGNYMNKYANEIRDAKKEQDKLIGSDGKKEVEEFNNLLGEITIRAEEYNKRVKEAFDNWDKNNQKLALHRELIDSINDSIADYENKIKNFSGIDLSPKVADTSGITSSIQMFPLSDEKEQDLGFDTAAYKKMLDEFEQFKNDFASLVVDFGVEVVDQFGQAIGTMIADGKFPDDFGKNVLAIIGGFISQLGKMLIGLGVASEAFQLLLKSAFTNPVSAGLAIAAGAALVLLGGAIQGAAKAGPTGSSSSGGGSVSSSSYSNSSYGGSTRAENNTVEFVIKGNTLVGVLNNQSRKNGLIG